MLGVDDDDAERHHADRGHKDRRAAAEHEPPLPSSDRPEGRRALRRIEPAVDDRSVVGEPLGEAFEDAGPLTHLGGHDDRRRALVQGGPHESGVPLDRVLRDTELNEGGAMPPRAGRRRRRGCRRPPTGAEGTAEARRREQPEEGGERVDRPLGHRPCHLDQGGVEHRPPPAQGRELDRSLRRLALTDRQDPAPHLPPPQRDAHDGPEPDTRSQRRRDGIGQGPVEGPGRGVDDDVGQQHRRPRLPDGSSWRSHASGGRT